KAERRAMEAERSVVDLYRAVLMKDRVGEEFDGTIAAVVSFGLFVQIEKPFVEGLVKLGVLDDQYDYDEETQRLVGRTTGRQFALGDPVRVRVDNVSVQQRKIDMALLSHTAAAPAVAEKPRHKRSGEGGGREAKKPLKPSPARKRGRDQDKRGGNSHGGRGGGSGKAHGGKGHAGGGGGGGGGGKG